jgi:Amino acid permease
VTAFGLSNVAPAGAVAGGLVIVVGYAGFAAPLVVLIALVASLCCAVSIAEFARRLPSAGSLYTYNSRGLGGTGGFLTGWMMVFDPRIPHRIPRRFQILSPSAHTGDGRRFLHVSPLGHSSPARPDRDGPAAVRGPGLARPGRHLR